MPISLPFPVCHKWAKTLILRAYTAVVLHGDAWILVLSYFVILRETLGERERRFEWKNDREGQDLD